MRSPEDPPSTEGSPMRGLTPALLATLLVTAGALAAATALLFLALLVRLGSGLAASAGDWSVLGYALAIGLADNVDNLGARIAYSLSGTKVSVAINLLISAITFVISFTAASLGAEAKGSLGANVASWIGMILLVALGLWMIVQTRRQAWHEEELPDKDSIRAWSVLLKPHHADMDASKHIDFKEGVILGVALSLNNVGGGLAAGVIGISPAFVGLLSAIISFVALWAGNHLAEFFVRRGVAGKAGVLSGVLLIVIGIGQLYGAGRP